MAEGSNQKAGLQKYNDMAAFLLSFHEGIGRCEEFSKKMMRHIEIEDKVKLSGMVLQMEEMYWKYFRNFLDKCKRYSDI